MAKYVRKLNKSDSRFYVNDSVPRNDTAVLKEAIEDAKTIRDVALENAKKRLQSAFAGVVGPSGVIGNSGVIGTSGVTGVGGYAVSHLSNEFVPSRGGTIQAIYNPEDNTYTLNGIKYTEEFINDLKAYHSIQTIGISPAMINPNVQVGMCPAKYAMSGSIQLQATLAPSNTGSFAVLMPYKTGSEYEKEIKE